MSYSCFNILDIWAWPRFKPKERIAISWVRMPHAKGLLEEFKKRLETCSVSVIAGISDTVGGPLSRRGDGEGKKVGLDAGSCIVIVIVLLIQQVPNGT